VRVMHATVAVLTIALVTGLAGPPALANGSAGAATSRAATVAVSPSPGEMFATPQTTISFRGITPAALGTVRVSGSRTGVHAGRLVADPDGYTIWKPRAPFQPGERVTVRTSVAITGAGGDSFSFTVANIAPGTAGIPPPDGSTGAGAAVSAGGPATTCTPRLTRFRSEPDLTPPAACVNQRASGTAAGYLFVTPAGTDHRGNGPAIFNNRGDLVWYDPVDTHDVDNLEPVTYDGQPMLAFFQGVGHSSGEYVLMNEHYQVVADIQAGDGDQVDQHELTITPENTALIGCYVRVKMNLTAYGGKANQVVLDYVVQEIDIATGNVLFSWDSLNYVPVTASEYPVPANGATFDYFHGNSIGLTPDGNLLISGRNVSAVYEVSPVTGAVIWQLGGKDSTFTLAPAGQQWFCYQHDVREPEPDVITIFDDGGSGPSACPNHPSRALTLTLDPITDTATITRDLSHDPPLSAQMWGSNQILPNGDDLVSWGALKEITEFNAANEPDFDMTFSGRTYRAFRTPWTGIPDSPPALATTQGPGNAVTAYMSWNGDTQVTTWQLVAGDNSASLEPVGRARHKTGFETKITVHTTAPLVAVEAISASGQVLAVSPTVAAGETGRAVVTTSRRP
jgi:hypothetical protein